nr:nucleotide exchange factor GrpE [Bacillus andreraoultii]
MTDEKETILEDNEMNEEKNTINHSETAENDQVDNTLDSGEATNGDKSSEASHDETKELKEKIEQLEKELQEKESRLLRVQADFDNYRKRTRGEFEAIEKYRSQTLATELLNVVDNFERALQTNVTNEDAKALLEGMEMVYKGMLEVFKNEGIEQIEAVGKEFNPHEHHAVMQGSDSEVASNIVLEEFQKGYKLKDRVIRPSMVKVNQ